MRTVFITRSRLGFACLQELVSLEADLIRIYTKPPNDGISDQVSFDVFSEDHDIPVEYVSSINEADVISDIKACDPELLFVVGWSELVSEAVIDIPSVAALGMHPSPLPRGRGRAPIAWTLIKGLDETTLSWFHLVPDADAGDLVGQEQISIDRRDDAAALYEKVISAGRSLVSEYYPQFENGEVPRKPQNEREATWWPLRRPKHGIIDWNHSAENVYNWIRGQSHPYPGAFSVLDDQRVTIWSANPPENEQTLLTPGEIIEQRGTAIAVATWEGVIELDTVQLADSEPIPASILLSEYEYQPGDQFTDVRELVKLPDQR